MSRAQYLRPLDADAVPRFSCSANERRFPARIFSVTYVKPPTDDWTAVQRSNKNSQYTDKMFTVIAYIAASFHRANCTGVEFRKIL